MLKHVHMSAFQRTSLSVPATSHGVGARARESGGGRRSDSVSLDSTMSCSSESQEPLSSRSSSTNSLNESHQSPTTTLKVYANCLRPDIEYKTLVISSGTSSQQVVAMLLNKFKMKHRDPKLFFLTMEVGVRKTEGIQLRTKLVLDDDSRPAELQSCHPQGSSRFSLQMRRGGLVRVYDSVLMPNSQYKSLLISEQTTVDDLIELLLLCHKSEENAESFSLYEVCRIPGSERERRLHSSDLPLVVQVSWNTSKLPNKLTSNNNGYAFVLKRNSDTPTPPLTRNRSPWSKSLDLSAASSTDSSSTTSTSSMTRSASYHDYENYFYI